MKTCEMIIAFRGKENTSPENPGDVTPLLCGAPAGLKREGIWLCAKHFDHLEAGGPTNFISSGDRWIPVQIHVPTQVEEFSSQKDQTFGILGV